MTADPARATGGSGISPSGQPPIPRRSTPERLLSPALALGVLVLLVVSGSTGPLQTSFMESLQIMTGHLIPGMPWMTDGSLTVSQDQAVWSFRVPRALLAGIAGASLALAGALLQANVRNPLAEPYILGVSAGAGVGAVVAIVAGSTAVAGIGLNATGNCAKSGCPTLGQSSS